MQSIDTKSITRKMQEKKRRVFNRLPKPDVMSILKDNLRPVEDYPVDRILDSCKYITLARKYGYTNYKLVTWPDILKLNLADSFTTYQKQFFADAGASVAIFNEMNGKMLSIVFRSTADKDFMDFSIFCNIYGMDLMDPDFKFGDPIVLVEGIYDADSFRRLHRNTLAMLTSNITKMQAEVLSLMTDNIIVAFDADNAGESGFQAAVRRFNFNVQRLPIYPGDKDVGVMEEMCSVSQTEFEARDEFYRKALDEAMLGYGNFSLDIDFSIIGGNDGEI